MSGSREIPGAERLPYPTPRLLLYRVFLRSALADLYLGDVGLRVTELERSIESYTSLVDLEELQRGGDLENKYVLFRDRRSAQRLEFNWYAETSPFWTPYVPGEGPNHIEVRVKSLPEILGRLQARGIRPVNRKLSVNASAVERLRSDPGAAKEMGDDVWTTKTGHRVAYIPDPDGNLLALYDHPEEEWEGSIPDHY